MSKSKIKPYELTLTVKLKVNGDNRQLAIDHLEQCFRLDGPLALFEQIAVDDIVEYKTR